MSLTSEQAKEISARPRIPPEVEDKAISMYAEGKSDNEVHEAFPMWAAGTFRNLRGRKKAEINDLRRTRTVQFTDVEGVRKQARVDDLWDLRTAYKMLFKAHLESCFAANPLTGEREFVERLVDWQRLKAYSSEVRASLKALMIETGQQLRLDEKWAEKALGVDGRGGVDYGVIVEATRKWDAGAPQRAAEIARKRAARDQWFDEDWVTSMVRDGMSRDAAERTVQLQRDRKNGFSPAEVKSRHWERVRSAEYSERVERLEEFCEDWISFDLEGQPRDLSIEELEETRDHLKTHWFPDDEAAHARVDCFFDNWRYPDAEAVASASAVDDEQTEEQDMDVEIVRMMPPRKPAEEPAQRSDTSAPPEPTDAPAGQAKATVSDPEPEPEHDRFEPLRAAFIRALAGGYRAADPDEMMRALRQDGLQIDTSDFHTVLGQLTEDDGPVVFEPGRGLWLKESPAVAVA